MELEKRKTIQYCFFHSKSKKPRCLLQESDSRSTLFSLAIPWSSEQPLLSSSSDQDFHPKPYLWWKAFARLTPRVQSSWIVKRLKTSVVILVLIQILSRTTSSSFKYYTRRRSLMWSSSWMNRYRWELHLHQRWQWSERRHYADFLSELCKIIVKDANH